MVNVAEYSHNLLRKTRIFKSFLNIFYISTYFNCTHETAKQTLISLIS